MGSASSFLLLAHLPNVYPLYSSDTARCTRRLNKAIQTSVTLLLKHGASPNRVSSVSTVRGPDSETCSHGAAEAFTREAQVSLQCVWGPNRLPGAWGRRKFIPNDFLYPLPFYFYLNVAKTFCKIPAKICEAVLSVTRMNRTKCLRWVCLGASGSFSHISGHCSAVTSSPSSGAVRILAYLVTASAWRA